MILSGGLRPEQVPEMELGLSWKDCGCGSCLMGYNPWKTHKELQKIVSSQTQPAWTSRDREGTGGQEATGLLCPTSGKQTGETTQWQDCADFCAEARLSWWVGGRGQRAESRGETFPGPETYPRAPMFPAGFQNNHGPASSFLPSSSLNQNVPNNCPLPVGCWGRMALSSSPQMENSCGSGAAPNGLHPGASLGLDLDGNPR